MSKLTIPLGLATAREIPVDVDISISELKPEGAADVPITAVTVSGTLTEFEDGYVFKGWVTGEYETTCDRCLEELRQAFRHEALWVFVEDELPVAPASDGNGREMDLSPEELDAPPMASYSGGEIDLTAQAWEEVALSVPVKFLCSVDCAGLCPGCGANLNHEACRCSKHEAVAEEKSQGGLKDLARLFPDLKPGNSEE